MRELPILTNCGVNSFSSSALFKFRDRRFSVRIRGISSCRERAMLLSFTSWLDWMPNSTCDTNPASGFDRPSQSSEENFVNCALSLDRILLSCMGDASWWFGFLVKTLLPRISSPPTSQSRQTTDLSMVRHSVFQILGKLLIEKKPGLGLLIFGQYFNRHETWAEQAGPWITYIARNAHMLQQGKFNADVAYFYGEEAPLAGLYGEGSTLPKDVPVGYGLDFVNSDAVLHQLSAANGGIETLSGMHYRLLYLGGSTRRMTLPVLSKIRNLVNAGAIAVGERPTGSPSLADNAAEFAAIAEIGRASRR